MRAAVALANIALGTAYTGYGVMTAVDMRRGWRTYGFSHFGAAWIFMAFTCGPHHLFHGIHIGLEGRTPGLLDLAVVAVGLPAGITWLSLRIEAFRGGRGDRSIDGTPWWMHAIPVAAAVYATALAAAALRFAGKGFPLPSMMIPNLLLVIVYFQIGYALLKTQLANREEIGGWSLSGISLTIVFPTCALMHGVWALYASSGRYAFDVHGFVIDWLAVPAAVYFLWVVRALQHGTLRDWNTGEGVEVAA